MSKRHIAKTRERLFKLIEALELLGKHYMITTLEQSGNSMSLRTEPRWIIEETECGNALEYELDEKGVPRDIPPGV